MSDTEALPVLMARVLGDLPAIGKDSTAPGSMGGYAFRGIEAITAALKPLLATHGVFVVPNTMERIDSQRPVGSNKTMYVTDVHVEWTFYGPNGDTLIASTWGEGTDMGDKATQKAYTSAFKSMLAQVFCISDSETDAERHEVPEAVVQAKPTDRATKDEIDALVDRIKSSDGETVHRLKANMVSAGLSFTGKLTLADLEQIEDWLLEISGTGETSRSQTSAHDSVPDSSDDRSEEPPPAPVVGATSEPGGEGEASPGSETLQERTVRLAAKSKPPKGAADLAVGAQ